MSRARDLALHANGLLAYPDEATIPVALTSIALSLSEPKEIPAKISRSMLMRAMYSRLPYTNWTNDPRLYAERVAAEYDALVAEDGR